MSSEPLIRTAQTELLKELYYLNWPLTVGLSVFLLFMCTRNECFDSVSIFFFNDVVLCNRKIIWSVKYMLFVLKGWGGGKGVLRQASKYIIANPVIRCNMQCTWDKIWTRVRQSSKYLQKQLYNWTAPYAMIDLDWNFGRKKIDFWNIINKLSCNTVIQYFKLRKVKKIRKRIKES